MNFTTLLSDKITTASQTVSAINCFNEYISSKFNDLANFMSGNGKYASVYLSDSGGSVVNKLACVSSEVYENACEEPDKLFQVGVRDGWDTGDETSTITVPGRDITDAFELQLSELRCQEQYTNYCLNAENCTSTEFLSRVRSLSPNLSGAVMEKYSKLIDISGSPIDCLKNFLLLFKESDVQYENQFISLVNYNEYTGNIWQSAWQHVTDTVKSFFSGVWQGIKDIHGFFTRLLDAVINLGQWVMSKAFSNLNTYYDKASSSVTGIMDLPIFQVYGSRAEWEAFASRSAQAGLVGYSWDGWNHKLDYSQIDQYYLIPSLLNLIRDEIDGVTYNSVTEVIVPAYPYDISIRVGRASNDQIVLSMHVVSDFGTWSKYNDMEHNSRIFDTLRTGLFFISSVMPMIPERQNKEFTDLKSLAVTEIFLDYDKLKENELAQCLKFKSQSVSGSAIISSNENMTIINSIICYIILMSKGFIDSNGANYTDFLLTNNLFNGFVNTYTPTSDESRFIKQLDKSDIDLDIINVNTFRPYSKRNQLPVTIHYQTSSERGLEILEAILKVVISSVVVISTVKFMKWKKTRSRETLLAHAQVDKLSWDVAANPSNENKAAFNKAWKKARKMDFVNGILGVSVDPGVDTIASMLGTITGIISQGLNESSTAAKATTGIETNFSSLDQRLNEIVKLIR